MKIGIDIHGVIDKDPVFFAELTKLLKANGNEVHIITGVEKGNRLDSDLKRFGVHFDSLFSITSYHKELGTPITYKNGDQSQPLIDDELWDITKAHYCCGAKIDIHIDDSLVYGNYFWAIKTQYIIYNDVVKDLFQILITK